MCVRNDSETHSTGVTGLPCNPVTQSHAFHCHFAHTRAFWLYYFLKFISRIDILSISCDAVLPSVEGHKISLIISEH